MKLDLKNGYKSITLDDKKDIESVKLPNFCIITGKNGSGKTHFLEAINKHAISITNDNYPNYGPSIYVDYHTVSFKGQLSYGRGSNPLFKNIDTIKNQIFKGLFPDNSFLVNDVIGIINLGARIIDKMLESKDEIRLPEQVQKLGKYEIEQIKKITRNDVHRINIDLICENSLNVYNQNKELLLSMKTKYHMSLESIICEIRDFSSQRNKDFKESLYNSYKNYLIMNKNMCIKAMKSMIRGEPINKKDIVDRFGENPLDFLNRIFEVCNYSFDTDYLEDDRETVISMDGKTLSAYKPTIILKKDTLKIDLDALSSGEKVILSLALLILENTVMKGERYKILLLDEIETNLHPSMLKTFLNLIQESFIKELGLKVFLISHSPSTIALAPEGSVFVMRGKDEEGKRIEQMTKEDALDTLTEGYATLEKGLKLFDQISKKDISIITEGNNTKYIKKALSLYYKNDDTDVIDGIEDCTGKSQLKVLFKFLKKCTHNKKVLFVFDCDVTYSLLGDNNTYVYKFEKNPDNQKVIKGIENLFPKEKFTDNFYRKQPRTDGGINNELDKESFMNHMLKNGTKEDFKNFIPLINKIKEIKKIK